MLFVVGGKPSHANPAALTVPLALMFVVLVLGTRALQMLETVPLLTCEPVSDRAALIGTYRGTSLSRGAYLLALHPDGHFEDRITYSGGSGIPLVGGWHARLAGPWVEVELDRSLVLPSAGPPSDGRTVPLRLKRCRGELALGPEWPGEGDYFYRVED
jgi:hypothetical protein